MLVFGGRQLPPAFSLLTCTPRTFHAPWNIAPASCAMHVHNGSLVCVYRLRVPSAEWRLALLQPTQDDRKKVSHNILDSATARPVCLRRLRLCVPAPVPATVVVPYTAYVCVLSCLQEEAKKAAAAAEAQQKELQALLKAVIVQPKARPPLFHGSSPVCYISCPCTSASGV